MKTIPGILQGYRTYIAAAILILLGIYNIAADGNVSSAALEEIAMGLGLFGLRKAIQ